MQQFGPLGRACCILSNPLARKRGAMHKIHRCAALCGACSLECSAAGVGRPHSLRPLYQSAGKFILLAAAELNFYCSNGASAKVQQQV
jgi:hypothetical protein